MTTIKSILRRLCSPARREPAEREIEDELQFHIEMRTRDNIAAGMSPEDAADAAVRRFGNFDQIRAVCEEIRKERLAGLMRAAKGLTWIMLGCGLMLKLAANEDRLRIVGHFLILISLLWRLLIYLRETRPDQNRITVTEQPTLSIIHTIGDLSVSGFTEDAPRPVPAYDKDGRTPVQKLISDEE